jgi:hypothetical protein
LWEKLCHALIVLVIPLVGCGSQDPENDGSDFDGQGELVGSIRLSSTFYCPAQFGVIGRPSFMNGLVLVPLSAVPLPAATVPHNPGTIQCSGGLLTIEWEPIRLAVPSTLPQNGKLIFFGFMVRGTPGPDPCPTPSACYPDVDGDGCAEDTTLLAFGAEACTVESFTNNTCELTNATISVCGTL